MNLNFDSTKYKGQRKLLVEKLVKKGINSKKVLNAINIVPRHLFMDKTLIDYSYEDKAYPIKSNQTISQPFTVAIQTQLLNIKKNEKILEIGTGSGYQTAILSILSNKIYTIERNHDLYKNSKKLFSKLNIRVTKQIYGDGHLGYLGASPYDCIIVTAGANELPKKLLQQLSIGGRLIIPVGHKIQVMTKVERISYTNYKKKTFGEFKFVPLLRDIN
tara:strand:- start:131601 stop:132251 length:651 start_codon:yes stop_codon:yes gene_type:complete